MERFASALVASACLLTSLGACAGRQTHEPKKVTAPIAGRPLPAETNPPGDIGDTQAFVRFGSTAGHYTVEYPESWSQTTQGDGVTFVRDFDGERVRAGSLGTATRPFAVVRDIHTASVILPAGKATLITFSSNSAPNAVTGKQVRLTNNTYAFSSAHRTLLLDLWAPCGTDNVDQWRRIAQSFRTN